ncbi:TolC family protein [Hyalangium versicolor]|uniref:TolC family protein n=1 Tax=Hyalangium versicolor TaxID=2861190 RepID=UPI001CC94F44|nr:TolC family protein [Hyalangium versicolor]
MNALLIAALLLPFRLLPAALTAQAEQTPVQAPASATPAQPQVSDPLLTPVPPAPLELKSWGEALGLLRQRSTDLQVALAQVESAAGQWRISLAALLPTLQGTASVQYNVLNPDSTSYIGGGTSSGVGGGTSGGDRTPTSPLGVGLLTASVPVVDLSAYTALGSARESQRAATLSLAETRRQLTSRLASAIVSVVASERLAEVNRVNLRTALERLALAQRRLELGAGTQLDVVRVQQDAETARDAVVSGDESLRQSREALGLALGVQGGVGLAQGTTLVALLTQARQDCHQLESLDRRADLAAARARLTVAERGVTEVKGAYAPTLALQSTTAAITVDPGFAEVPTWNIGAALVLPFWDGGVREGRLRVARAQAEVARQNVVALERSVEVEVNQSRRAVTVAQATRDIAARARALAEESDRLTRRSFEVGTGTSLELVQSAGALRQAELQLVLREFQFQDTQVTAFLTEAACDW